MTNRGSVKQLIPIILCFLVFAFCNRKQEKIDAINDSVFPLKNEVFVKPSDFCLQEHIDENWAKLYTDYIHDSLEDVSISNNYALCFIDNDTIPELCFYGRSFGEWSLILTQHKGEVTAQYCDESPEYIERTGMIKSSIYSLDRTLRTYIYKLQDGVFTEVLETEAKCHYSSENPFEQWNYFVYSINGTVIDTLYGMDYDEWSCIPLTNSIKKAYDIKGTSKNVFEKDNQI